MHNQSNDIHWGIFNGGLIITILVYHFNVEYGMILGVLIGFWIVPVIKTIIQRQNKDE